MKLRATTNHILHRRHIATQELLGVLLQVREKHRVFNERNFDRFSEASDPITVRKRPQKVGIVDDGASWGERTNKVLLTVRVHTVFYTDTSIILR